MIEERFARTSKLKTQANIMKEALPESKVKVAEDVPVMSPKVVEKAPLEVAQEEVPSKDDTLRMIEQRRKATQDRIKAHLNGLDKNTEEQEKKDTENVLANEERAPDERGSEEVPVE